MIASELFQGSNTLMDPWRSNIGGPDPCDHCGVDAYVVIIITRPSMTE